MSEYSESARAAMKEKAGRLSKGDPQAKVDASSWTPPELEGSQKQTGERVLSKRAYKAGGRVAHILGEKSKGRADRSARASGGLLKRYKEKAERFSEQSKSREKEAGNRAEKYFKAGKYESSDRNAAAAERWADLSAKRREGAELAGKKLEGSAKVKARKDGGKALTADSWTNRDVKEANQERDGFKHVGGFNKGGAVDGHPKNCTCNKCCNGGAMKASGGSTSKDPFAEDDDYVTKGKKMGGAAVDAGGRQARKSGGRTKGKTNINIIIGAGGKGNDQQPQMPNMPMRAPVPPPIVPPVAGPPPMAGAAPPMGAGAPPMMRKAGGRASTTHVIDNAAGGGKGRLQKISAYGLKH